MDNEKALNVYQDLIKTHNGDCASMYVSVANSLSCEVEGDNFIKMEELNYIKDIIGRVIIDKYLLEKGYYLDDSTGIAQYKRKL